MDAHPRQNDCCSCGLYAAMYMEVFCMHAAGEFVTQVGEDGETIGILCDGPASHFLMDPTLWFNDDEVDFLRLVLAAGMAERWLSTWAGVSKETDVICKAAKRSLEQHAGEEMPAKGSMW